MHKRFTKLKDSNGGKIRLQQKKNAVMKGAIFVVLILAVAFSGCIGNAITNSNAAEGCADSTTCS
ncbi:MAG: hypothetical protein ABIE23_01805, partial [archaeon]